MWSCLTVNVLKPKFTLIIWSNKVRQFRALRNLLHCAEISHKYLHIYTFLFQSIKYEKLLQIQENDLKKGFCHKLCPWLLISNILSQKENLI